MTPLRNKASFCGVEWLATRPTPVARRPPLFCFLRLVIQYIRSYSPYSRSFLHPQPVDAPCRGDRDPLDSNTNYLSYNGNISRIRRKLSTEMQDKKCVPFSKAVLFVDGELCKQFMTPSSTALGPTHPLFQRALV